MANNASHISWREIPLFRILIPFLLGVLLAWWTDFSWIGTSFTVFFITLSAMLGLSFYKALSLRFNYFFGLGVLIWFMCFAYWRASTHHQKDDSSHFANTALFENDSLRWWHATIKEIAPKGKSLRARVHINAMAKDQQVFSPQTGQLLLYLPPDSLGMQLQIGNDILFYGKVAPISPPLNPDAFDFSSLQAKKNVFHQSRITSVDWFLQEKNWTIRAEAVKWRQYLMSVLREHLKSGSNELAVGAALILGHKDELGDDIRNAYTNTGAVHVLAVSGLHVGFVAWAIGWLLGFGPFKKKSWRWARLFLNLLGVWAFALVTGLSPSVMRAACMFSFILIGQTLSRKASIYNILAASALMLLLIDPFLVFNIGFQLSYLAVLGIVYFQPRIYKSIYPPNKVLDYFWKLSSVALAAQIATLPLSLFYFHQFPVYFLLSGIVVVTAASFILGLGILLLVTSFVPVISSAIGWLLSLVLWLTNAFILGLSELPGGLIGGVWITVTILVFLYLSIGFIARFLNNKRAVELMFSIGLVTIALLLNFQNKKELSQQRTWTIYHQYKETIVDAFDGMNRYTFSTLSEDDPILNWGVWPHREKYGVVKPIEYSLTGNWMMDRDFIGFYDKKLLMVDRSFNRPNLNEKIDVDIVLLKDASWLSLKELTTYIQANYWVIDGSNPPSVALRWIEEAKSLQLTIHWTAKDGAFILKL